MSSKQVICTLVGVQPTRAGRPSSATRAGTALPRSLPEMSLVQRCSIGSVFNAGLRASD